MSQPQLLEMALVPGDVVYTPDWVARDMVDYFKPSGKVLEPCAGDGAFLKHLPPHTEWCEIEKGRDFFKWQEPVDWIFGNPPYSTKILYAWMEQSFRLAENVVYLVPINKVFQSWVFMDMISAYGGIASILNYGDGKALPMGWGYPFGAFHFRRGWKGETRIVFRKRPLFPAASPPPAQRDDKA